MPLTVEVLLRGLPENVQALADKLDAMFPDEFVWTEALPVRGTAEIVLLGHTQPLAPLVDDVAVSQVAIQ